MIHMSARIIARYSIKREFMVKVRVTCCRIREPFIHAFHMKSCQFLLTNVDTQMPKDVKYAPLEYIEMLN